MFYYDAHLQFNSIYINTLLQNQGVSSLAVFILRHICMYYKKMGSKKQPFLSSSVKYYTTFLAALEALYIFNTQREEWQSSETFKLSTTGSSLSMVT